MAAMVFQGRDNRMISVIRGPTQHRPPDPNAGILSSPPPTEYRSCVPPSTLLTMVMRNRLTVRFVVIHPAVIASEAQMAGGFVVQTKPGRRVHLQDRRRIHCADRPFDRLGNRAGLVLTKCQHLQISSADVANLSLVVRASGRTPAAGHREAAPPAQPRRRRAECIPSNAERDWCCVPERCPASTRQG